MSGRSVDSLVTRGSPSRFAFLWLFFNHLFTIGATAVFAAALALVLRDRAELSAALRSGSPLFTIAAAVLMTVVVVWLFRRMGVSQRRLWGVSSGVLKRDLVVGVALGVLLGLLGYGLVGWTSAVTGIPVTPVSFAPVVLVYYWVVAPVSEELFFRGFLLLRLRNWPDLLRVPASTAVFTLAHDPVNVLGSFTIGLVFCMLFLRTGRLLPVVVAHVTTNIAWNVLGGLFGV